MLAGLSRCVSCLVRVPVPTSTGECLGCLRRDAPKGAKVAPWPLRSAEDVDDEGSPLSPPW